MLHHPISNTTFANFFRPLEKFLQNSRLKQLTAVFNFLKLLSFHYAVKPT